jgi:hypothetical protein
LLAAVFEAPAGVAGLDDVVVVGQEVEHGERFGKETVPISVLPTEPFMTQ